MANDQKSRGLVQAQADPSFFFVAVLIVKLGQQYSIKEDGRSLLESDTMVFCVSLGLDCVPLEAILELLRHGVIVSWAFSSGQRPNL